ncbi:hypothetical protein TVAG_016360 [Trichomonas vaginalis G3]|uniref:Protein YIF1 n=2 Tax=Trichomonas vaginalis (strain ATCC PRA-98 / G3) TaxID=412133 RepID=A2DPA6_TRIV3|nr:ER to Golgi vesicle-mediated transport [Trichomonas vaginalis G3]XP_001329941.1 ER to Golgi vesicle-mediated transport [Trichomonas vaginalis G3]XP_051077595.1 ER to Golgi vesicle-mediated transport [Trichomonas vaginalis G3]EAY17806.1 hypothetical protein TVAG_016360 [Trichomonas vaginalis G3]KAI5483658.1 ER to Golgi vesicle-mediated transport [Trichomonas vaginalis G3]KAI5484370.1 ER to Golgi vesicle-mediated transport [Trichomonas vaginalis G3]KAI5484798.1 ER to Golgi vesicle-mediated t|eukprot:XP_001329941.1 hypothetical protein [Trichomonas vaginalis G3]
MLSGGYYQGSGDPQDPQQQQPQPQSGNPFMSPEVFKYAQMLTGGIQLPPQFQQLNTDKLTQQFQQSQSLIPPYFAITRASFLHKIKNLACPFIVKQWSRSVPEGQTCSPIDNPNAPELYTPLVFTFIFMLITSLIKGAEKGFSMDFLYICILKFICILFFEIVICKLCFSNFGIQGTYPILSLLSDFSSISFYLTIISLFSWNRALFYVSYLYCAAAAFLWTLRTLNSEQCMAQRQTQSTQIITYFLLILAAIQIILLYLLAPKCY